MILIGSRAAALNGFPIGRKPVDWDLVAFTHEIDPWLDHHHVRTEKRYEQKGKIIVESPDGNCEFEVYERSPSARMLRDLCANDSIETPFGLVPPIDLLFTIKQSHRYLKNSPHFYKTAQDWHRMRLAGARVRPEYEQFLSVRESETYTYTHPKLNQSKQSFFSDDGIQYVWDHDSIHRAVAIADRPAYTFYIRDGAEVQTSREKFFAVSHETRLNGVVEEAAVLAIERSLVPHPGVWTPEYAWRFALSKVCTSITSGWFRQFAFENLPEVLKRYPADYWDRFQRGIADGSVIPFTGNRY